MSRQLSKWKPYSFTRLGRGSTVNGKWADGPPAEFKTLCLIQPFSLREMMALPEGERTKAWVKIYSVDQLLPVDQEAQTKGDRFTYLGKPFEVQKMGTFDALAPGRNHHFKSVASSSPN